MQIEPSRLTFIESLPDGMWKCQCQCGNIKITKAALVKSGKTRSCGCLRKEMRAAKNLKHGHSRVGAISAEYVAWQNMHARCENPSSDKYKHYGGRGIKVCERWGDFENFLADMKMRPTPQHSVGRIDNEGDYEPTNCEWQTLSEQRRNMRSNRWITFCGDTLCLEAWADRTGINSATIDWRLRNGWSLERSLTQPVRGKANG